MLNITILICLYKKSIYESNTIQSLIKSSKTIKEAKIYIWDNSPAKLDLESLKFLTSIFKNLIYKHTPENTVLSKVYNSVIEDDKALSPYLALFDDDSEIPINYFEELKLAIELYPTISLFLPLIYSNSVLVSPARYYYVKSSLIKKTRSGIINSNYITAINSGMVISNSVFTAGFRYDENLNFYGTDNFFMYKYVKNYPNLVILNVKISHDMSFNNSKNIDDKIRIFKEIKRANNIIYSNNKLEKSIVCFYNFLVAIKFMLKYKNLAFLYD